MQEYENFARSHLAFVDF